jgi:UDP-N-acetylmuramate--alanine ligase
MSFLAIICVIYTIKEQNMLTMLNFLPGNQNKIFFCGMAGASMSALAALTVKCGKSAIGSDVSPPDDTLRLFSEHGITLYKEHKASNVYGCDALVYSAAVRHDNPELCYAREQNIPIYTRSRYLGLIASGFPVSVACAGTHGKSTVTHMIACISEQAGISPTVLAGARSVSDGLAYRLGTGDTFICEACEYNRSFLDVKPNVAVILNVEREHTDTYPTLSSAEDAYFEFAKNSNFCILNYDCPSCKRIEKRLSARGVKTLCFSLNNPKADAYCENIEPQTSKTAVTVNVSGESLPITLSLVGEHNAANAVAAILCAKVLGYSKLSLKTGIEAFKGIKRRLEYIGSVNGADVYDDYAHHPTEIKATLKSVKQLGYKRIICAFQPHTYSRTSEFFDEFSKAFVGCNEIIFADIYAAREKNVYGVSSKALAEATPNGIYLKNNDDIKNRLLQKAETGTLILTMGAGRMNEVAYSLTQNTAKGKD